MHSTFGGDSNASPRENEFSVIIVREDECDHTVLTNVAHKTIEGRAGLFLAGVGIALLYSKNEF